MSSISVREFRNFTRQAHLMKLATLVLTAAAVLPLAHAKVVSSVPGAVAKANNHGRIEPATPLKVTVWLAMHNKAEFDRRVEALYAPGSPTFHQWLTTDDLLTYAPTRAELQTIKQELEKSGLTTTIDETNPFAVRAEGSADKVQAAFGTEIDQFERNGTIFHANISEAQLKGAAEPLVLSVSGLDNIHMKPMIAQAKNPKTGMTLPTVPLAKVKDSSSGLGTFFTNNCFQTPATFTFGTSGSLPFGVYFGNDYDQGGKSCGYTASQMQAAYGLPAVYKAGYKGAGQTIVIVDAYGSPTIQSDANEFNALNGLPALTSSNFKVIYPDGPPLDPALGEGWIAETSLDVEWAHAIAPSAKIVLLAAASQDDQDFQLAVQYATLHKLGSVVSNSYGLPELEHGPVTLDAYNQVIEQAAATGISVNYSSGDSGDEGLGTPVGAVSTPADSPYATAVGGTSLGIPGGSGTALETGWGNNQTFIAFSATQVEDPPYNFGNVGGAGGGSSIYFAKPGYQKALPGQYRQVPDVSMEADPYTGAVLIYTDPVFGPVAESIGGTSLSCPMFSAFWALANEKAGHLLGQAAPIISKLPSTALSDILPGTTPTNLVGTVIDNTGATFFPAAELAAPLQGTTGFVGALWPIQGEFLDLTFGTDTSLTVTPGWDNVTGYGTPLGLAFVTAAAGK